MSNLSAERYIKKVGAEMPAVIQIGVDGGASKIWEGAMVSALTATGLAVRAGTASSGHCIGVAENTADNSAGSDGAMSVNLLQGSFWFGNSSAGDACSEATIGHPVYIVDDQTVADNSNSNARALAGLCVGYDATDGVLVYISAALNEALEADESDLAQDLASVVATFGSAMIGSEDAAGRFAGATVEAQLQDLGARVLLASASETTIKAIPAAARADGTLVVDLTNNVLWQFDAGSAAGASAWVLVPDAGTGRWLRNQPSLADLAAVTNAKGASLLGIEDAATIFTATTVEGALAEMKLLVDAGMPVLKKTLTSTHASLVAAAATETVSIGTALPANSRIVGVDMHTQTSFSGGTISDFTVDVGMAGDVDALVDGADLFAAAVDGGPATMPAGIRPNKFYAAGGQLQATFRCGSDDVADASAGAITIDVLYVVLA